MNIGRLWLVVFGLLLFANCNRVEGCLEADASNFDPGADKNCCCEYPNLTLQVYPVVGPTNFTDTDTLYDSSGNPYLLPELQLYLSQFQMIEPNGEATGVSDSLAITLEDTAGNSYEEKVADSYILLDTDNTSYEVGTFLNFTEFSTLEFYVGVDSLINLTSPATFDEEHALYTQDPVMYDEDVSSYLFVRAEVQVIGESEPRIYTIYGEDAFKKIEIPYAIVGHQSFDTPLELTADVEAMFDSIDFLANSDNFITEKIVENLDSVFSKP